MAHLAPRAAIKLAVQMKLYRRVAKKRVPVRLTSVSPQITEKIYHNDGHEQLGRAEWEPANGAQLLLKLAGQACVKREMSGIVRSGCKLVDEQLILPGQKKLNGNEPNHSHLTSDRLGNLARCVLNRTRKSGWNNRVVEDVVRVDVLGHWERRNNAVDAASTDH